MEQFTILTGVAAPLPRINVDTDTIIPKAWCKSTGRTGFGRHLFHDLRYGEDGRERPGFVLNRPPWREAAILVAGANFGCGSSREAAVWALREFGIRCIIAPSFSDIFAGNSFRNGLLALTLPEAAVSRLCALAEDRANAVMTVDLPSQRLTAPDGEQLRFEVDPYWKECLLNGLDEIGMTMTYEPAILAYENKIAGERTWQKPVRS